MSAGYTKQIERLLDDCRADRVRMMNQRNELLSMLNILVREHFAPFYAPSNVRAHQWARAKTLTEKIQ
jgi:hypothetical protein